MARFNEGDRVVIRDDYSESWRKRYCFNNRETAMMRFIGQEATIVRGRLRSDYGQVYYLDIDRQAYFWAEDLLIPYGETWCPEVSCSDLFSVLGI